MFRFALFSFYLTYIPVFSGNMVYVDEGNFFIGQSNAQVDEIPIHRVYLSSFYISKFEVSIREWTDVTNWGVRNGYHFSSSQYFPRPGPSWFANADVDEFPMNAINWYDAVKWCNAKSEMEGRTPCYYISEAKIYIYRSGEIDLNSSNVKWDSTGYRLPTEVEWEKAARGKYSDYNYPWGDEIDGSMANYKNSNDPFELGSGGTSPVGYYDGNQTIQSTVNLEIADSSNYYGLFDIVGNVSEWCWDWYNENWYSNLKSNLKDTKGPSFSEATKFSQSDSPLQGKRKVHRGGAYNIGIFDLGKPLRTAFRHVEYPHKGQFNIGLRYARADIEDDIWFDSSKLEDFPHWYFLKWFGYYYNHDSVWVYHTLFGWIYPVGEGSYDNWIYFPKHGWLWTSRFVYPYFYSAIDSVWYQYDLSNTSVGWFINSVTEQKYRWGRMFK